jgi:hypothetical protein
MNGVRQRFLGLCLPPMAFCLLDATLTLAGQSAAYWDGAYGQVNEASPTFNHLLALHPLAFVAGILAWMAVFVGILLLLPDTLALIVCIAVTLGHTAGSATWVLFRFQYGYQACNGLFLLAAVAVGIGVRWGWQAAPRQEYRLPFLTAAWRWALAAVLFGCGVYLFLWPRSA